MYSRFRPLRTIRAGTEIHNAFTAVSFLHGVSDQIVIGTNSGEIRMYDTNNSDVLEVSGGAPRARFVKSRRRAPARRNPSLR